MINKSGSIAIVLLVGILTLVAVVTSMLLIINEKYSNVMMTDRVTSRYIAESAIEVQKYLLHNKFDNAELKVYYEAPSDNEMAAMGVGELEKRVYRMSDKLFRDEEIENGDSSEPGIVAVNAAVDRVISEVGRYSTLRDFSSSLKLYDPNNIDDTDLGELCTDGSFLNEDSSTTVNGLTCDIQDLYFLSNIRYQGGIINAIIRVSGLEVVRESFFSGEEPMPSSTGTGSIDGGSPRIGEVRAKFLTDNVVIETYSFQDY